MADHINLDTETLAVLARFNDGLERLDAVDRRERAVKAAEKAKDEAAATLRAVEADSKATAEAKSSAQDAYRSAVEAWQDIKRRADAGEDLAAPSTKDPDSDSDDGETSDGDGEASGDDNDATEPAEREAESPDSESESETADSGTESADGETEPGPDAEPAADDSDGDATEA